MARLTAPTDRKRRPSGLRPALLLLALSVLVLTGCEGVYYSAMEQVGLHKRDILVQRVSEARDSQQAAKEQFESALERFNRVVAVNGGDLEARYDSLKKDYRASRERAETVSRRIDSVEDVAEDLFDEWRKELGQYTDSGLRRVSKIKLDDTRTRYLKLIEAMRRAEAKMVPVLAAFKDQVLFLKHNLNARAISSLQGELASVEADIARLVRDMEASIREADRFIKAMGRE